jgi:hypothetical protein
MAGVAFAVDGDGVGFATESYASSALYTTLASFSGALWRIRRASRRAVSVKRSSMATLAWLSSIKDLTKLVAIYEVISRLS